MVMHPHLMPLPHLEAALGALYAGELAGEAEWKKRAELARAYHDRTGHYYAARLYVGGSPPKVH
jgi:hypothetical protein